MRDVLDLSGYWQGALTFNPAIDVKAPAVVERNFYIPLSWNRQIEDLRWPSPDQELSNIVRPVQNQNFRDVARKFSEGIIVYTRTITLDPERFQENRAKQRRLFLVFEGSNYRTTARVNGDNVGIHDGGHLGFEFEVTAAVKPGNNLFVVTVDNHRRKSACPQEQFNWENHGGITRPVRLEWRSSAFVKQVMVFPGHDATGWHIDITVHFDAPVTGSLQIDIQSGGETLSLAAAISDSNELQKRIELKNPLIWEPGKGGLSHYKILLETGASRDEVEGDFGVRTVAFDGRTLQVNGQPMRLFGASWHEHHPLFGTSLPEWQIDRDLALMRQAGLNAIRAAHYPHAPSFYRACDRAGMLVLAELPCWQFTPEHFSDTGMLFFCCHMARTMVSQLVNHPSIIGWVVQNESQTFADGAVPFFGSIAKTFKSLDPTRFTVSAESSHPPQHVGVTPGISPVSPPPPTDDVVDVAGINCYAGWYRDKTRRFAEEIDRLRAARPATQPIFVTEFGAEGIPGHRSLTMEPWTEDYQTEVLCHHISAILERRDVAGFFIWLFMDYPCGSIGILGINSKGLVDPWRRPKLAFNAVKLLLAQPSHTPT